MRFRHQVVRMHEISIHCCKCEREACIRAKPKWNLSKAKRQAERELRLYNKALKMGWRICHGREWICPGCKGE